MKPFTPPTRLLATSALLATLAIPSVWATAAENPAASADSAAAANTVTTAQATDAARKDAQKETGDLSKAAGNAVAATSDAILLLDKGDKDAALAKLAEATGQLEIAIAAEPKLAMIPIASDMREHVLMTNAEQVQQNLDEVQSLLESGRVQAARALLNELHSDISITVAALPVASYPDAIKLAATLTNDGQLKPAAEILRTALTTVVEQVNVIPMPVIASARAVAAAEQALANDKALAQQHLEFAADQLDVARLLGYMHEDQPGYEQLRDKIAELRKQVDADGKSAGLFKRLKETFNKFFGDAKQRKADATADPAAVDAPAKQK